MKIQLPKIYPITDQRLAKISHVEQVKHLIEGGATFIQLREKYHAPNEFYEIAKQVLEIARPRNVKIIINDRTDIALSLKADGVHLGQTDLPPAEARKILGERAIIGYSTHNIEQVKEALKMPVDYIAFGPIFSTQTKENPDAVTGIEILNQVRETIGDFPLVAIGGINSANFLEVLSAGADSLAIISDLISKPNEISNKLRAFDA